MPVEKTWDKYELGLVFASYNDIVLGVTTRMEAAMNLSVQLKVRAGNMAKLDDKMVKNKSDIIKAFNLIDNIVTNQIKGEQSKLELDIINLVKEYGNNTIGTDVLAVAYKQCLEGYYGGYSEIDKVTKKQEEASTLISVDYSKHEASKKAITDSISNDSDTIDNNANSNEFKVLYTNPNDYAHSKPTRFTYFGKEYKVDVWSRLYVSVVKCIQIEHPRVIESLIGKNVSGGKKIDVGDKNHFYQMRRPVLISNGLYLETNLSSEDIIRKIVSILGACDIELDKLAIYYTYKNNQ